MANPTTLSSMQVDALIADLKSSEPNVALTALFTIKSQLERDNERPTVTWLSRICAALKEQLSRRAGPGCFVDELQTTLGAVLVATASYYPESFQSVWQR
jgi:hypothetical protein